MFNNYGNVLTQRSYLLFVCAAYEFTLYHCPCGYHYYYHNFYELYFKKLFNKSV